MTVLEWRRYDLAIAAVPGPVEAIPTLLLQRTDLPGPRPGIVYYHGVVQNKEAYIDTHLLARRLADAGYAVAIPDAPGHGTRPAGATLIGRLRQSLAAEFCSDIDRAGDEAGPLLGWLGAEAGVDGNRLGVCGISMGGFTTAVVAARHRSRIGAAVCIAGSADLRTCMAETDSIAPGRWGPPDRALSVETSARIDRIDPLHHAAAYAPLPLLLLHGERDTWNPARTSQRFYAALEGHYSGAAPGNLQLTVVPEAVHWPPTKPFVDATVAWFDRFLRQT